MISGRSREHDDAQGGRGARPMRLRRWRPGGLLLALLATLLGSTPGWAQPGRNGTPADPLARLRIGHWILLEGMARGTGPVVCSEARSLAGDFLDDDYTLKGLVRSVDPARQEFSIGACRVRVTRNTTFDHPLGTLRGIKDIRAGMIVDVEGTLLEDGALLASEVDDESDELAGNPSVRDELEVTAKIEQIDLRRRVVKVLGFEFRINARTRLLSAID
jgi:uncharacterized protein DUF5666